MFDLLSSWFSREVTNLPSSNVSLDTTFIVFAIVVTLLVIAIVYSRRQILRLTKTRAELLELRQLKIKYGPQSPSEYNY